MIYDAEDCREIVCGSKIEQVRIAIANDANKELANQPAVDVRQTKIKNFRKRAKKTASLIIRR